jgi:hypothetical protein
MHKKPVSWHLPLLIAFCCVIPWQSSAQPMVRVRGGPRPVEAGSIQLPYRVQQQDDQGNFWMIYPGGWMQQQGRMPVTGEMAMPRVNGAQPQVNNNTAKLGADGELILDGMTLAGCSMTRHIYFDKAAGYVRIIDVFKNDGQQAVEMPLTYHSSMNYGMTGTQALFDARRHDQQVGVVGTDGQNRAVMEIFAGNGSKILPTFQAPQNSNQIDATLNVTVPPGKEVAIMQIEAPTSGPDAAQKLFATIKQSKLLSSLPKPLRRLVVNFGSGFFIGDGDYEVLRGEAFDVAEMKSGDQMRGTLHEPSYHLNTFYGTLDLPAEKVVSLINIGDARPRQLLVCGDGEVFGGFLDKQTIELQLTTGQITKLPLAQIARLGYRHRAGEPEEWAFDRPLVLLDSNERLNIQAPAADLPVSTRYGSIKLNPSVISSIAFQNEDNGVHEIYLTDGSKFAGLVDQDFFEFKLAGLADRGVKIPTSDVEKLQLHPMPDDVDANSPTMRLRNDDLLVGTMSGQYKLDTLFDTLTLDGDKIKSLVHNRTSPTDVVVQLWDETTVSGQLEEKEITCQLKSGLTLKVPLALVVDYHQPQPSANSGIVDRVKQIVAKLNADDQKERDDAQKELIDMGQPIVETLRKLRADAPPEAQQRIDTVLQSLKNAPANPQPAN